MALRKCTKTFWDFNILAHSGRLSKNIALSKKKILKKNYKHHHDFHEIRLLCNKNSKLHQSNAFNDAQ